MAAPNITNAVTLVTTTSTRMAPHVAIVYLNIDGGATAGAGDWHECDISWRVTNNDDTDIAGAGIQVLNPLPGHTEYADNRFHQKGFVCAFLFEAAGDYRFTCTVTNRDGDTDTDSEDVTVAADTRTAFYYNPNGSSGDGSGSSSSNESSSWTAFVSAAYANNKRCRIRAGTIAPVTTQLTVRNKNNVLIDTYGGNLDDRATFRVGTSFGNGKIIEGGNCQNIIVRNIEFDAPVVYADTGPSGIGVDETAKLISAVNCASRGMRVAIGGSNFGASSDSYGYAVINCDLYDCNSYGAAFLGWYYVSVFGLRVHKCPFSHAFRIELGLGGSKYASIGYTYLNPYFGLERLPTGERWDGDSRFYALNTYIYSLYQKYGLVQLDSPEGSTGQYLVFDRCYFKNGCTYCLYYFNSRINTMRFSACILDIDNRYRSGECPDVKSDRNEPAFSLNMSSAINNMVMEGITILVGDHWKPDSTTYLLQLDNPGAYAFTNSTTKNVLVCFNNALTFPGKCVKTNTTAFGAPAFSGCCWPFSGGNMFLAGTTEYTTSGWIASVATSDVKENISRLEIQRQRLRPNATRQPVAAVAAVDARDSYYDYFGAAFITGGATGAVVGGPVLRQTFGIPAP